MARRTLSASCSGLAVMLACGLAAGLLPAGALAQQAAPLSEASRMARLEALSAQAAALEAQTNALKAEIEALRAEMRGPAPVVTAQAAPIATPAAAPAAAPAATPAAAPAPAAATVTVSAGRPTFTSADGSSRLAVRGMFQLDAARYSQDRALGTDNRRGDAGNPADLSSGSNLRRARIGVEGLLARDWSYAITLEFGGSATEVPVLNAAMLEYTGFRPVAGGPPLRLRMGAFATPTSLEDATSNTEALFIERAAAPELARGLVGGDARTTLGLMMNGARWSAGAALTGGVAGQSGEFDEQTGYILRGAVLAASGPRSGLVLGLTANGIVDVGDTDPGAGDRQLVRLRERPELRLDGLRFVDTGAIPAAGVRTLGLEAAGWMGPLYLAGEYLRFDVERTGPGRDPSFSGWYLQGAWTLTGETRRWSAANGGIGGIRPSRAFDPAAGRWGALEIAARYSLLDLNSDAGAPGTAALPGITVRGGEQTVTSLGLNWYLTDTVRFSLAQQWVEIDRLDPENGEVAGTTLFGGAPSVPGNGAQIGQSYEALSLRTQVTF
jgi:phosphate-selective porin OprO and OprP